MKRKFTTPQIDEIELRLKNVGLSKPVVVEWLGEVVEKPVVDVWEMFLVEKRKRKTLFVLDTTGSISPPILDLIKSSVHIGNDWYTIKTFNTKSFMLYPSECLEICQCLNIDFWEIAQLNAILSVGAMLMAIHGASTHPLLYENDLMCAFVSKDIPAFCDAHRKIKRPIKTIMFQAKPLPEWVFTCGIPKVCIDYHSERLLVSGIMSLRERTFYLTHLNPSTRKMPVSFITECVCTRGVSKAEYLETIFQLYYLRFFAFLLHTHHRLGGKIKLPEDPLTLILNFLISPYQNYGDFFK